MHKIPVCSALGKRRSSVSCARTTESIALSLRQFHLSTTWAAEEPALSPGQSARLARNQAYSQRVQNLAQDTSQYSRNGGDQGTGSRSIRLDSNPARGQPVDLRALAATPTSGAQRIGLPPNFRAGLNRSLRGASSQRGGLLRRGGSAGRGLARGGAKGGRGGRGDRGEARERRPRRGGAEGGSKGTSEPFLYTAEEIEYMRTRDAPPDDPAISIELAKYGVDSLVGGGPSVFVGTWGKEEMLEERLNQLAPAELVDGGIRQQYLAKKLLEGEFVRFRDDAEKDAVLTMAAAMTKRNAELKSEEKGEVVEPLDTSFEPLDPEIRTRFLEKMFMGKYVLDEGIPSQAPLPDAITLVRKNGSYFEKEETTITRKIKSLLPIQTNRPARTAQPKA